jgi:hypothetical protein
MNLSFVMRGIRSRVYPTSLELIAQVGQARLEYPRIHDEAQTAQDLRMDCRVKPGNDEVFALEIAR